MRALRSLPVCALLVAALFGTACDSVRPAAFEVDGREVSQDSVDRELRAIADNEVFIDSTGGEAARTEGSLDAGLTAQWLTLRVEDQIVSSEIAERNLEVTDADRQAGLERAQSLFGNPETLEAFPSWFRDDLVDRFARRAALLAVLAPEASAGPTEEEILAAYEEQLAQERARCASGRFVAHILVETSEEAEALVAQLAAGADFTERARAESVDTQSAEVGGELFCFDPTQFVPEFSAVAEQLPLGQVSAPVATEFGFHLIVVRDTIPFEAVEPIVRRSLTGEEGDLALREQVAAASVSVDPRYGRWRVQDGQGAVEPRPAVSPTTSTASTVPIEG